MKVYNIRRVGPHQSIEGLLIKILFPHWSIHLFQSNQRFQAIEFVDRSAPEKLDIFAVIFPKLSSQNICMALGTPRFLSAVSTVSARNAWDHESAFDVHTRKKEKETLAFLESQC